MEYSISEEIARQLRAEGPFHLPPAAQPLNAVVTLRLEGTEIEPMIVLTDVRRSYSWHVQMTASEDDEQTWLADVQLPMNPTIVTYYFLLGEERVLEKRQVEGQNTPIYGEWQELPFKIAVYDADRMPADWTKGMVVYQIFPDRFAKVQSDEEAQSKMKGVYGHEPRFMNWGEIPESPPLGRDFYGGDLRGIIEKMDYLADLGIDCIYLNPVFEAASNHRYEAIDFMKIDQMLGTEADFDRLLEAAHARGIKVILDAVFNHCSSDSIYFDITGKYSQETGVPGAYQSRQSPYFRWFKFREWPEDYDGWIGLGFMPEFVECPEMEDYFLGKEGVTAYWLRKGIDGWRADVAGDNTDEFWRRFRTRVDETKPEAWLISEDWRDATHYMLGDMFNGTMNYRFAWAVRGFFASEKITASELDDRLQVWMRDTPEEAIKAQMNLLDSHDTGRVLTTCSGDRDRFLQMLAFQLAYPGAPTIYYGNETGLEGTGAEDGRRCFPWDNIDADLHAYFSKAINLRKNMRALRVGETETVIADDQKRVYGFCRWIDRDAVYAVFNASDTVATFSISQVDDGMWIDVLGSHPDVESHDGQLWLTLQPRAAVWYTQT